MDDFRLYNTLTRQVEIVSALTEARLSLYTCGPTVYDNPHIGNMRSYIFEDVLLKTLREAGFKIIRVMNITDVGHLTSDADSGEDKLQLGARREGKTAWDIARKYEQVFLDDIKLLNIEAPEHLVRATDTVPEQINLIKLLEAKGFTYNTEDGVYFDTSKFPNYGQLAQLNLEGQRPGARVELRESKKNPTDFALWKFSGEPGKRDMEWESPWGLGFPGWHIECSAIILKTIGVQVDIHCGGIEHIPVHHTNEVAQSESATGVQLARYWCHADHLLVDGGKMSKSLNNGYTLADLKDKGIEPLAFRLFSYSASYRSKLNFTWEGVEAAQKRLHRLRKMTREAKAVGSQAASADKEQLKELVSQYEQNLFNDLNIPKVIAQLEEVLSHDVSTWTQYAFAKHLDKVLSLDLDKEESAVDTRIAWDELEDDIKNLVNERKQAREGGNWPQADAIRDQLIAKGYELIDGVGETIVLKSSDSQ